MNEDKGVVLFIPFRVKKNGNGMKLLLPMVTQPSTTTNMQGIESLSNNRMVTGRAAQYIDKEILMTKNSNIDIEIDKRMC